MESTNERKKALEEWLFANGVLQHMPILPMPHDASFRRYFRVATTHGSRIAMDAVAPQENCHSFMVIAKALRAHGLLAPEVFAADITQGFLLLSDFGDQTYLSVLNHDNADQLYTLALTALSMLQACSVSETIVKPFNQEWMRNEWAWHKEWFLGKWLGVSLGGFEKALDDCYSHVIDSAISQPQVFMHRDYHSANLMVLPEQITNGERSVGILDFQDAFIGPITYDLVSLLRDCYIDWPLEKIHAWVITYWQQLVSLGVLPSTSLQVFLRWFDLMGVQRHLKALFTFARKHVRDQQSHYLKHIPRTLNYILYTSCRYPELNALHNHLHDIVKPAVLRELSACVR